MYTTGDWKENLRVSPDVLSYVGDLWYIFVMYSRLNNQANIVQKGYFSANTFHNPRYKVNQSMLTRQRYITFLLEQYVITINPGVIMWDIPHLMLVWHVNNHSSQNCPHKSLFQSSEVRQQIHDDVIKWKHFQRYWPFVRGIHRSPVNSPHKGQWRGALMFSLICARINSWVNNRAAGDLRCHRAHYDVILILFYRSYVRREQLSIIFQTSTFQDTWDNL